MAIVLGLLTAVFFGAGDFFGGLSTKRVPVIVVVGVSHLVGLIGVLILTPILAERFGLDDFLLGVVGGLASGAGVILLYRGLARGPMVVVAPLTAITAAAIPAFWGVANGETFTALAWLGIAVAGAAIVLTSLPSKQATHAPITSQVVIESLAAGALFGFMLILFDSTEADTAPWPVVGARLLTSTALLGALFVSGREHLRGIITDPKSGTLGMIVLTGLFDTGSNVLFLLATARGDLTIVAVLSSLYPAFTVVLARTVLEEPITRPQLLGLSAAIAASVLIALG